MPRTLRSKPLRLDADARARLRGLLLDPNLLGYGFGARRCGSEWIYGPYLCLYVRQKFTPEQIRERRRFVKALPRKLGGNDVDVLQLGEMQLQDLDHRDEFGSASAAALTTDADGSVLALLSGHATPGATLLARDRFNQQQYQATVLARDVGGMVDWALARFTSGTTSITLTHALGQAPPLLFRKGGWQPGEPVSFYSGEQHTSRAGVLVHHGGHISIYSQLLVIRPTDGPDCLSVPGDSGSLVFDSEGRALGMVIGSGAVKQNDPDVTFRGTFIASIAALQKRAQFQPYFSRFFV